MTRYQHKLKTFYGFAESLSSLSTCKRATVGCVVVTPTLTQVLAVGYNGPPSGISNTACRNELGNCGCIHAECNALVKLRSSQTKLLLLCTTAPCELCAGLILNCKRISQVYYGRTYRTTVGLELLMNQGISIHKIGDDSAEDSR